MAFLYNSGRIKKRISESAQAVGNTGLQDDGTANPFLLEWFSPTTQVVPSGFSDGGHDQRQQQRDRNHGDC
jgi:hypothetical protein